MVWKLGRQNTGYATKRLLHSERFRFDLYLIRYTEGTHIPEHTDPTPGGRHYRVNVVLWPARKGGKFFTKNPSFSFGPIHIFRSDINPHQVTKVERGVRYALSFGIVLKEPHARIRSGG